MENKIVALYIKGQNEIQILYQDEKLKKYCKDFNLKNCVFYIDEGFEGVNSRPSLKALENDIDSGKIDSVIVTDVSRLSRDAFYLNDFFDKCFRLKVNVKTVDGIDCIKEHTKVDYKYKRIINSIQRKENNKLMKKV